MVSLIVLVLVALFRHLRQQFLAVWTNEDMDFNVIGQAAELAPPAQGAITSAPTTLAATFIRAPCRARRSA